MGMHNFFESIDVERDTLALFICFSSTNLRWINEQVTFLSVYMEWNIYQWWQKKNDGMTSYVIDVDREGMVEMRTILYSLPGDGQWTCHIIITNIARTGNATYHYYTMVENRKKTQTK